MVREGRAVEYKKTCRENFRIKELFCIVLGYETHVSMYVSKYTITFIINHNHTANFTICWSLVPVSVPMEVS